MEREQVKNVYRNKKLHKEILVPIDEVNGIAHHCEERSGKDDDKPSK